MCSVVLNIKWSISEYYTSRIRDRFAICSLAFLILLVMWKAFHVWLDLSVIRRNLWMRKFADQRKNERQIWPHNVILIYTLNHYRAERKNWSIKKNSVATRPSTELKASQKPPNFRYKQCTLRLYDCGVHVQTGCKYTFGNYWWRSFWYGCSLLGLDILARKGNTASYLGFNNEDTRNELKTCRHPAADFYFTILARLLYKNYYNK